jgi:hypothetical protein
MFDATKGTGYNQYRQAGLHELWQHPLFQRALTQVPWADVELMETFQQQNVPPHEHKQRDWILQNIVAMRWLNPICEQCLDKSNPSALFACAQCGLAFYCSHACQRAHSNKHAQRCCKLDGPAEDGPQAMAFAKIKK